ncbi:hypothetical protein N9305_00705 [Pelagibacteraceae bacterium]|nr:hypothetical protein [Pelagibacteraceae bacterium]
MIYKSYLLEKNTKSIYSQKAFLFYGENEGLKNEFKKIIKTENKNSQSFNFNQEEIIKNSNLLINEITNKSLFEDSKIIFIDQVNDKILHILDEEVINSLDKEMIFLFTGILDKKSKIRNYFEKSNFCGITACYKDNEITIKKIISEKLNKFKGLTPQILNLIIGNTGLDRNKINNEIEKIESCFLDKIIDADKLELLLNIRANDDFNQLKDDALSGNKVNTNKLLGDTVFEPENNIFYLNSINQRINRLKDIEELKDKNSNLEELLSYLKPPVFWKDKPMLIEQSRKWNKNKIQSALNKTYNAEIEIKSNANIRKDLIIKNLIIDLCSTANAS